MTTFIGDCDMFGTGSISGIDFGSQIINSATYGVVSNNQININLTGIYTSFNVIRTNITGGNIETTFTGQTGSTFTDNGLTSNTQYSYKFIPVSSGNEGPTFPLSSVWTLVNVTYNTFSNTINSVQINWSGIYSSISVTRTSPTSGTPTGSSSNYPTSSSPQTSVTGYLTDVGLTYNTYIYTITATNGGGTETVITTKYTTSISQLPLPTFGTLTNVSASSYGTYNYWIVTGNNTITFDQPTTIGYMLVGGGGSGANSPNSVTGGGGGGGGGVCWSTKSASTTNVTENAVYTITVGNGSSTIGISGGNTIFSGDGITTLTANGGYSGEIGLRRTVGTGGAGGSSNGGKNNISGGSGSNGSSSIAGGAGPVIRIPDINKIYQCSGGGGGGSAPPKLGGNGGAGGGGNGSNSSNYIKAGNPENGSLATYYGGGGGGQVYSNITAGYNGFVLIYY